MDTIFKPWFLVRYGIVGATSGIIQTLILYLWIDVFHFENHYLIGAVVGFCIALAVTFTCQKYWTFRDPIRAKIERQFALYTTIALLTLGLNVLLLHLSKLFLEHLGLIFFDRWYLLAQVVVIIFLAGVSFLANYFLTFHAHRSPGIES